MILKHSDFEETPNILTFRKTTLENENMSDTELHKRIAELELENRILRAENKRLRETLNMPAEKAERKPAENLPSIVVEKESAGALDKYSAPEAKIELFMSLFRGRTDVYAKRCYSKKHGSGYYVPACKNEWINGVCEKPRVKCKNCTNRELQVLTAEVIDGHLRNKDENGIGIVGVYPLLPDENCLFLAIDFDGENWGKDISVFRSVCKELNIPIAVERSRSGNGAHVWMFFEDAVPAASARKLGNTLLTRAMSERHEIRFDSYDRMFPNQDFMPQGGFGNLIALPLQGGARKNGNSEFIDENFQSYSDQWAYLGSVKKFTPKTIDKLLAELCEGNGLGELGNAETDGEEKHNPWEGKKREIRLKKQDFPDKLTIIEANRLYVLKKDVSQRGLNRIKRLAAFSNPQFYKMQKMRMSTHNIPRIIYSLDDTAEYTGIPRGCRSSLVQLLEESDVNYSFEDKRNKGENIKVEFTGTLREEQQSAATALLQHENGVLSVPTAFGKTVIGASLIAKLKCNTLILVHLHTLFEQWKKSLEQFLAIDETLPEVNDKRGGKKVHSIIGQIGSGKNTSSGIVDIALVRSLIHDDETDDVVKNYGMVIVDECHHVPSVNYEKVLSAVNAKYVYGLTATPLRRDGQHPITFMQCGAIRYSVDAKSQADKRNFEHYIIPCFTGFKQAPTQDKANRHISKIYSAISEDEFRNRQIAADVIETIKNNRTPIILTQRREHVAKLADMLQNKTDAHIVELVGTDSVKVKSQTMDFLMNIPRNEKLILVATGKYVGEGFDYPRLDTLFLASPIAWKGTLAQYAGRLHREYPEKPDVMIYDYVDIHVPVLERMYHKRLTGYAQMGYKTLAAHSQPDEFNMIYDVKSFEPVMTNDFAEAKREILIVSPFLRKKRMEIILERLKKPLRTEVSVTVVTRPPESFKERERITECIEHLQTFVTVIQKPNIHQKYVIIDNRLVWYGSINLLSYGSSEESIMRLESRKLAAELERLIIM